MQFDLPLQSNFLLFLKVIAGVAGGLTIAGGLIGSTITGIYIDKTRNYTITAKMLSVVMTIASAAIIVVSVILLFYKPIKSLNQQFSPFFDNDASFCIL